MIASVHYGFFGIDSLDGSTLQIAPQLPEKLDYWGMENLQFNGVKYDVTVFDNAVMVNSVRGDTANLNMQVVLNAPKSGESVYVNGKSTNRYTVKDGKVYVTLPFGSATVIVK